MPTLRRYLSTTKRSLFGSLDALFHLRRTVRVRPAVEPLEDRILLDGQPILITAPGPGEQPFVKVFDAATGALKLEILAYDASFQGGVRVAATDFNGDGQSDIVTAAGPGGGPHIKIFNGASGAELASFFAFNPNFTRGLYVAAGDVNGDGAPDIIAAADAGGSPQVKVFSGQDQSLLASFQAFNQNFNGGVRVAAGDVNGDGKADIIAAAGPGGGPHVKIFSGANGNQLDSFFAYNPSFGGGVYVAAGDADGDGKAEVFTGAGPGGGPHVKVFRGPNHTLVSSFFAFDPGFSGGVRVGAADVDSDGLADVTVGAGPGGAMQVRTFAATGQPLSGPSADFYPYGYDASAGVFVAAGAAGGAIVAFVGSCTIQLVMSASNGVWIPGTPLTLTAYFIPNLPTYPVPTGSVQFMCIDGNVPGSATLVPSGNANIAVGSITVTSIGEDLPNYIMAKNISNFSSFDEPGLTLRGATYYSQLPPPPLPPPKPPICLTDQLDTAPPSPNLYSPDTLDGFTDNPVRYFDGVVQLVSDDLAAGGYGAAWGHTRSWTNGPNYAASNVNGEGMVVTQLPALRQLTSGINTTLYVVRNGTDAAYFDYNGSAYQPRFFSQDQLTTASGEFILTASDGSQVRFCDFNASLPTAQRGAFKSLTDPYGNTVSVVSRDTNGKPTDVQRAVTAGGTTTTESYQYSYLTSGNNAGKLSNVTLRRQVGGGSWTTIRQVDYTYYDNSQNYGTLGDLKFAVIKDGAGSTLDTKYYRYYKSGDANGYARGLKYVFLPEAYARLAAAFADPTTATDAQVAPYADNFFEYESTYQRVTKETAQGAGCSNCSGGQGTYTYTYTSSSHPTGVGYWRRRTVETLPDANQNIVYTNDYGQVLLHVYKNTTSGSQWATFYKYDAQGRLLWQALPSAVSGYDDTKRDLVDLQSGNYPGQSHL